MGNWREQLDQLSAIAHLGARVDCGAGVGRSAQRGARAIWSHAAVAQRYANRATSDERRSLWPRRRCSWLASRHGGSGRDPCSYEVRGGSGFDGPYVSASPLSPAELLFSDGSNLQADPGCRLRVDETYRNGARVFVERGYGHIAA